MPTPRTDRSQQGSYVGTAPSHPEKPYRRFEASPTPASVISATARASAVAALRKAAAINDPEHAVNIALGGVTYVQKWLSDMADSLESREYERDADGTYTY